MPCVLPLMGIKKKASLNTKEAFRMRLFYVLFYCNRFGQVSGLVYVAAAEDSYMVGQ